MNYYGTPITAYNILNQIKKIYAGKFASVISLESLQPIKYLVELDSGDGDIIIAESKIEKS